MGPRIPGCIAGLCIGIPLWGRDQFIMSQKLLASAGCVIATRAAKVKHARAVAGLVSRTAARVVFKGASPHSMDRCKRAGSPGRRKGTARIR